MECGYTCVECYYGLRGYHLTPAFFLWLPTLPQDEVLYSCLLTFVAFALLKFVDPVDANREIVKICENSNKKINSKQKVKQPRHSARKGREGKRRWKRLGPSSTDSHISLWLNICVQKKDRFYRRIDWSISYVFTYNADKEVRIDSFTHCSCTFRRLVLLFLIFRRNPVILRA